MQKTIFVVDDSATNLSMAEEALENHYQVITLSSATKMFGILPKLMPDLILLDIEMPEMDGFDALRRLKASESYSEIPVIFLTSMSDSANEARGIELGAADFIAKPFSEPVLLNRIKYHLQIDSLIHERTEQLREKTAQLVRLQNTLVHSLADVVERRDNNTGGHIDRTTVYTEILLTAMVERGTYADEMSQMDMGLVISSARLHDVGKILIPDSILNKPGPLSKDEYDKMKTHAEEGERIIGRMEQRVGEAEFLRSAKLSAAYHHERWDGTGYPFGLKEKEVPLHGRVMAVVDVYDALTSERPYKRAFSHDEAVKIIMEDAGRHFDPQIAKVFNEIKDQIEEAKSRLSKPSAQ
jgi:putative two-component system response regulator